MATLYAGATIKLEATIHQAVAFGTDTLYDPASGVTITIIYENAEVVSDAAMTKSTTGKYYYYYQSEVGKAGKYEYEVTADDTTYDGFFQGSFSLE